MRLLSPALPFLRGRGGKGKNEEKAPPAPEPAEERICPPLRKVAFHMAKRVASEAVVVAWLAVELFGYLIAGWWWVVKLGQMVVYVALLSPAFLQVAWYYMTSRHVVRSVVYGPQPRNRLDLYLPAGPPQGRGEHPVVIFLTGGAWIIGYKAWGALLGRRLAERGVVVACLDYRNFPQGRVGDMVDDVDAGVAWVLQHAGEHGGDPAAVTIIGQSAGAHLGAASMLRQVARAWREGQGRPAAAAASAVPGHGAAAAPPRTAWAPGAVHAFVGISGPYDIPRLVDHFHARGLHRSVFLNVMGAAGGGAGAQGEAGGGGGGLEEYFPLEEYSPVAMLQREPFLAPAPATGGEAGEGTGGGGAGGAGALVPDVVLLHGTADLSIPARESTAFHEALEAAGARCVRTVLYEGKSHTDPIVNDPVDGGGGDCLLADVVEVVRGGGAELGEGREHSRLVPHALVAWARRACPF